MKGGFKSMKGRIGGWWDAEQPEDLSQVGRDIRRAIVPWVGSIDREQTGEVTSCRAAVSTSTAVTGTEGYQMFTYDIN